jgi:hypothetical protein
LQSVFIGATLIGDENIKSYVRVFKTFLKAMGGAAPHLITTDEDASITTAIAEILTDTVPEKVGPSIR